MYIIFFFKGSSCSRGDMQDMVQESVIPLLFAV